MKILLSVAVWGHQYARTFADYSLPSQLSPNNIPRLAAEHEVAYHIVTTRRDAGWLKQQASIIALERFAKIVWDHFEDRGFDPFYVPAGMNFEKYPFLSRLQNLSFECSVDYDILVFNYADFIWADGSIRESVLLMHDEVDGVLGFCLPVDRDTGKRALDGYRADRSGIRSIDLPCRVAAGLAIDHMHSEAKLRLWEGETFTSVPTYLLWRVGDEGLVMRAYHQTILALRVRPNDPDYKRGIPWGSLDGCFSAILAEHGRVSFATDSDKVTAFSLYHTNATTALGRHESREASLQHCLRHSITEGQRRFAEIPLQLKRSFSNPLLWTKVTEDSWGVLCKLHGSTASDYDAFVQAVGQGDIGRLEQRWRKQGILRRLAGSGWKVWFYRVVIARFLSSRAASFARTMLGERARRLRLSMERWIFGRHR